MGPDDWKNKTYEKTTQDEDYFDDRNRLITKDKKMYELEQQPDVNDETTVELEGVDYSKIYYHLQSDITTAESTDKAKEELVLFKQKETTKKLNDGNEATVLSLALQKEKENELQLEIFNKLLNKQNHDVDSLTSDEIEIVKQMDEYQKEQKELEEKQNEYLVRGAMMKCTHGSHYRRLNLPESHGVYTKDRPLMNENDSLEGDEHNVPSFGICDSCANTTGNSVLLKKDVPRDKYGKPTGAPSPGEIRGIPCSPVIISNWMCPNDKSFVEDAKVIQTKSFLICKYEGIIEVVDSGQDDEETAITEDSKA